MYADTEHHIAELLEAAALDDDNDVVDDINLNDINNYQGTNTNNDIQEEKVEFLDNQLSSTLTTTHKRSSGGVAS